ncbi:GNAT family N-acetyltransferase [Actinoplanes sp. NBRC 103695]|uniref:GNAT family N-acetyltransferase n=1 Tax=Actinoplanes sp. NBRC 103695 TaxID=3032202 RepID=UPI0024A2DD36|nr:GNAT family N-acetyltransferase [Actinoplanes sp. NBRC 103695]GLY93688.1 N-acetyltransferase [Actinoplanes sp. NBRC 103695]
MTDLRTDRLILRQWRDDDLDPWAALNADPQVREFFGGTLTREESLASMSGFRAGIAERGWGWWAVEVAATGTLAGLAGLDPTDPGAPIEGVEIGWRLSRETWGFGYATEAARACLAYGFDTLNLPEIVAIAAAGNTRSHAVMTRLGMIHDPALDFADGVMPSVVYRLPNPAK